MGTSSSNIQVTCGCDDEEEGHAHPSKSSMAARDRSPFRPANEPFNGVPQSTSSSNTLSEPHNGGSAPSRDEQKFQFGSPNVPETGAIQANTSATQKLDVVNGGTIEHSPKSKMLWATPQESHAHVAHEVAHSFHEPPRDVKVSVHDMVGGLISQVTLPGSADIAAVKDLVMSDPEMLILPFCDAKLKIGTKTLDGSDVLWVLIPDGDNELDLVLEWEALSPTDAKDQRAAYVMPVAATKKAMAAADKSALSGTAGPAKQHDASASAHVASSTVATSGTSTAARSSQLTATKEKPFGSVFDADEKLVCSDSSRPPDLAKSPAARKDPSASDWSAGAVVEQQVPAQSPRKGPEIVKGVPSTPPLLLPCAEDLGGEAFNMRRQVEQRQWYESRHQSKRIAAANGMLLECRSVQSAPTNISWSHNTQSGLSTTPSEIAENEYLKQQINQMHLQNRELLSMLSDKQFWQLQDGTDPREERRERHRSGSRHRRGPVSEGGRSRGHASSDIGGSRRHRRSPRLRHRGAPNESNREH